MAGTDFFFAGAAFTGADFFFGAGALADFLETGFTFDFTAALAGLVCFFAGAGFLTAFGAGFFATGFFFDEGLVFAGISCQAIEVRTKGALLKSRDIKFMTPKEGGDFCRVWGIAQQPFCGPAGSANR